MTEDECELIKILHEKLGLTSYESRAYIAILLHGVLSPTGVNQKSGIPRSRTYDVLKSLVEKGLLMEQAGRPRKYTPVDPPVGLGNMMMKLERKMRRRLEEKRKTAQRLSSSLTKLHTRTRARLFEEVLSGAGRRKEIQTARAIQSFL